MIRSLAAPLGAEAERLARLHAAAFGPAERGWSAEEFEALAASGAVTLAAAWGLAVLRVAGGEAELLTLAVERGARRQGAGAALLAAAEETAARAGAARMILEVADDNAPAHALYARAGYHEIARRPRYYRRTGGGSADALVLAGALVRDTPARPLAGGAPEG